MPWLLFVIFSYLIYAAVVLVDKYLLSGAKMHPAAFTFYIGALGMLAFVLVPFVGFVIPSPLQLFLSIGAGASLVYAIFWFAKGVQKYEPSRIIPAMGGFSSILVFLFLLATTKGETLLSVPQFASLGLLIMGTVLIAYEKGKGVSLGSLKIAFINATFFALAFVMAKYIYLSQPFWSGFILMRLGGLLVALLFLLWFKEVRHEVLWGKETKRLPFWENPRVASIFVVSQGAGAGAEILRNLGIFLVPVALLPFINALLGIQYVAILVFAALLSWKFPHVLREHVSKDTVSQKVLAILLMALGLGLLTV